MTKQNDTALHAIDPAQPLRGRFFLFGIVLCSLFVRKKIVILVRSHSDDRQDFRPSRCGKFFGVLFFRCFRGRHVFCLPGCLAIRAKRFDTLGFRFAQCAVSDRDIFIQETCLEYGWNFQMYIVFLALGMCFAQISGADFLFADI